MNETQKSNFSLLNQKEIDALVGFLNDNRSTIDSDVMNQDSVDKLISLITGDSEHIITSFFDPFSAKMENILSKTNFRTDKSQVCEIKCSLNDNNYICLTAYNTVTGDELEITPKLLNEEDCDDWGYSISPFVFNHLALFFDFKYTRDTHDNICNIFAKHMYGSETHKVSNIYLPSNDNLLKCLL